MVMVINPNPNNPKGAAAADNALKAIEVALMELCSSGVSQAWVTQRWGANVPTGDLPLGTAITASMGRRGVS